MDACQTLIDVQHKVGSRRYSDGKDVLLTAQQRREIKEIFNRFDQNHDEKINEEELANVMRSLGFNPTREEITDLMVHIDDNGNGTIDYEEFERAMAAWWYRLESQEEEMQEAFRTFDKNGDGFITVAELRAVASCKGDNLTSEEADEMIRLADKDGNGKIDYTEFAKLMTSF